VSAHCRSSKLWYERGLGSLVSDLTILCVVVGPDTTDRAHRLDVHHHELAGNHPGGPSSGRTTWMVTAGSSTMASGCWSTLRAGPACRSNITTRRRADHRPTPGLHQRCHPGHRAKTVKGDLLQRPVGVEVGRRPRLAASTVSEWCHAKLAIRTPTQHLLATAGRGVPGGRGETRVDGGPAESTG
jgi:hypothetical protein